MSRENTWQGRMGNMSVEDFAAQCEDRAVALGSVAVQCSVWGAEQEEINQAISACMSLYDDAVMALVDEIRAAGIECRYTPEGNICVGYRHLRLSYAAAASLLSR